MDRQLGSMFRACYRRQDQLESNPMATMQKYVRLRPVNLEEGLALLKAAFENRQKRTLFGTDEVNTKSMRLKTFVYKGTTCSCCGLSATHFALERGEAQTGRYHLNLWGIDAQGQEVLFTQDHIKPLSAGGQDHLSNSQTMCGPCNWAKADTWKG